MISKQDLQAVHERIKPYIHNTPVLTSRLLNEMSGAELFFKCENFQRMGAFKMRGAANAILNLPKEKQEKGVVTHSSGNFAQAVSLAAKSLGVPAYIVMPSTAPQVKKDAVKGYGGKITECPPTLPEREKAAQKIMERTGATFVHPSNDLDVIYGQGTAAIELLEEQPDLEVVVTPVGGGGLIAGTALAANYFGKNCKTVGAEPFEADDAWRSLQSGKIEENATTNTIADGLKTQLGEKNFPIIQKLVSEIIRVEENEIIAAMKLIWERMKLVVEPSSATALAAILRQKEKFKGKKVGIIISGGNVDLQKLPF
ncbi:threonine dehydratase [Salinimicrobium catena]|uniref:Threonine dehydratase n=1 Tax=Salinimicrobium catena TaxID=390640 RepID=A0A1H5PHG9_9FLAO|nr:pyridoxal-phosphate dependent enzyme [Salinimicrobium catena]SDL85895.1 threonine dehydratase [Salinimicrobium catena]SEF13165.1 threonine dehydratase [Salinimicrobium catena]